ncbi:drug/metabolite transporter (DMT)-like permease [Pararhizobium capsulatum DSM 1112]|uniref:Drug/metabolite transporter (DMT)-like permease n=1 Tax=Pararhizobium capsulatum DSM 1112 TaxID=1121113 RepID=A0ABU0BNK8_9HYPH|nr:DMT family transporter [Pararhizobium capsulatum]MDQ0319834.1 drug/metabolite transporter (DMT)-like permease [Pararhizobium capsulatum DSM 1112]
MSHAINATDGAHHRRGLAITGLGGLALSFDIPLLRSGDGEVWSVLALRSVCTFIVALIAWAVLNRLMGRKIALIPGKAGLVVGLLYGVNSFTFLLSVFNTSTANVVFILAFTSMFAALMSWIFLKERPSNATLITMAIMVVGVGLIVHDGLESGNFFGDAMAASSAFLLAGAITISRASGKDMGLVPLATAIVPAIAGLALLPVTGFAVAHPQWIMFDGLFMIPLAFFCLATGPRYLTAPEVGMFYLLETILAPIWIWMIFMEVPTTQTLLGGAILIFALIGHSLWQMRRKSAQAIAPPMH